MNLNELRNESYRIAKSKGWHDEDAPRATLGDRCALIISELSEALEEYRVTGNDGTRTIYFAGPGSSVRECIPAASIADAMAKAEAGNKPEGVPIEMADVAIRIGDLAGRYALDLEKVAIWRGWPPEISVEPGALLGGSSYGMEGNASFGDWLMRISKSVARAWGLRTIDGRPSDRSTGFLVEAVLVTNHFCNLQSIDLIAAIKIKHAFNETRPYRHGGKKI